MQKFRACLQDNSLKNISIFRYVCILFFFLRFSLSLGAPGEILCAGSSIVDYTVFVPDAWLQSVNAERGGCLPICKNDFDSHLLSATRLCFPIVKTGGSAGIVVKSLGLLGSAPLFFSTYGSDKEAQFFKNTLQGYGVTLLGKNVEGATGQVLCCISPDGQRTFFFCKESIGEPDANDVTDALVQKIKILHIEGYILRNKPLLEKLLKVALNNKIRVSLDLGTFVLVKENREYIKNQVLPYIHFLIGNYDEMKALFHSDQEIDHSLKELACTSIVLKGEEGCLLYCEGVMKQYATRKVIPRDTTGAGDLFTCGFLFGIVKNWSLEKCVRLGNRLGGEVVQHIGGEIPQDRWDKIKCEFSL